MGEEEKARALSARLRAQQAELAPRAEDQEQEVDEVEVLQQKIKRSFHQAASQDRAYLSTMHSYRSKVKSINIANKAQKKLKMSHT